VEDAGELRALPIRPEGIIVSHGRQMGERSLSRDRSHAATCRLSIFFPWKRARCESSRILRGNAPGSSGSVEMSFPPIRLTVRTSRSSVSQKLRASSRSHLPTEI
jgi:hypothetical protein